MAWSQVIFSNIVAPGTSSTPPTMTRPGSPAACASTASMTGPMPQPVRERHGHDLLAPALGVGQLARDVAPGVAVGDVAAAVVELLAARQPELDLGPAALVDVQPQRHDRLALGLGPAQQLVDLGAVEQQLAGPLRLVVVAVAALERGDVGADQPRLAALDARVGVGQVGLAGADAT